jgi:formylglycine-generating enzyme required for sulfatase activity
MNMKKIYIILAFLATTVFLTSCMKDMPDSLNGYTVSKDGKDSGTDSAPVDQNTRTFTVNDVPFKMIRVDGGTFTMGATSEQGDDAWDNEKPAHKVTLSSYYIGETEVTQELWQAVMGSNPSWYSGSRKPVECVSWYDCQEFIRELNSMTGQNFRLPTEAEWEFAARGGNKSRGYKYAGSNNFDDVSWHSGNSNRQTHVVETKVANELGLYDMSGNVWEWCQDWDGSYSGSSQTNPTGPSSGSSRVQRGGSWNFDATYSRVSSRYINLPSSHDARQGLRLALRD